MTKFQAHFEVCLLSAAVYCLVVTTVCEVHKLQRIVFAVRLNFVFHQHISFDTAPRDCSLC